MQGYTIVQWLFFFYFYCFFGWIFESSFVSIKNRKIVNRGFMRGPFLPIYGCGAIMMLVVSMPFRENIVLTYFAGCAGATALELVTGELMEALFKIRYWDYSNQRFNYKGHICLSSTIAWGFLTVIVTRFLHKVVESICFLLPIGVLKAIVIVLSIYIVADFSLSFRAAMNLRNVLIGLEKAREEMEKIQKRLDVLIAVVNESLEATKQTGVGYMEGLMDSIEGRFVKLKEHMRINPGAFLDDVKDEIIELRGKYMVQKDRRLEFRKLRDFFQRDMIRNNPMMKSTHFAEALEELKKVVSERKKKDSEKNK